jgi:hypothetical protein
MMSPAFGGYLHDPLVSGGVGRAIAAPLSILMGGAWAGPAVHRQFRLGDPIWTFAPGLTGAGSALWPLAGSAEMMDARVKSAQDVLFMAQ